MSEVRISDVKLGDRHRHDLGDVDALVRSIQKFGLLHPIVVTPETLLIVGRRRLEAYRRMGRTEIPARILPVRDILRGELEENTCRKDFTPAQMVAIGRAIKLEEQKAAKERMVAAHASPGKLPEQERGQTRDKIAAYLGVSGRTFDKMTAVVDAAEAEPEKNGKLLAAMERTGRVNGVHKRLIVARKAEGIRREPPPLPEGPFRVLVADPPWPYELRKEDPSQRGTTPYPQMSIEQIKALPVADIAHADAILLLWTTNMHMRVAFEVLDAWGFQPKTILTWFKDRMGTGDWLRGQTEHCLLAVKGTPVVTLGGQTTALRGPVRAHSEKPDEFYALVESLCPAPAGGRAELFQRTPRPGWVGHGDEVRDGRGARAETAA